MSRVCELCEKSYQKGNQITRLIGRRVSRRTIMRQQPNLRYKRFVLDGTSLRVRLCTSCLKRIKNTSGDATAKAQI